MYENLCQIVTMRVSKHSTEMISSEGRRELKIDWKKRTDAHTCCENDPQQFVMTFLPSFSDKNSKSMLYT